MAMEYLKLRGLPREIAIEALEKVDLMGCWDQGQLLVTLSEIAKPHLAIRKTEKQLCELRALLRKQNRPELAELVNAMIGKALMAEPDMEQWRGAE